MKKPILLFFSALLASTAVYAQTPPTQNFTFSYRTAGQTGPVFISPNGTITAPDTAVGSSTTINFTLQNGNTFSSTATIGADGAGFSASASSVTAPANGTASFDVKFAPTKAGPAFGTLTLLIPSPSGQLSYAFFLGGGGTAPLLSASYTPPGGNQTILSAGSTLAFQPANVGSTVTATVSIANTGTGIGSLDQVTLTGNGFSVSGLPLLPAKVSPGNNLQFFVSFTPPTPDAFTGTLHLFWDQTDHAFPVTGTGLGATWKYSVVSGSQITSISANGNIQPLQATVGASQSVSFQVQNIGTVKGTVASILVTGTDFKLANVPPLTATLQPGESLVFTVTFSPSTPGSSTGLLTIDGVKFNLSGTGVGSALQFTFVSGTTSTPLSTNSTVNFPNTQVGTKTTGAIQIQNTGNVAGSVNAISITGAGFTASALPALPLQLAAGQTATFNVAFAPDKVGPLTGTLQVDNLSFALRGVGGAPPSVGTLTVGGLTSQISATQQAGAQLTLDKPYSLDLNGVLTLGFTSAAFTTDPSLQFAAGGRTIAFTIPANTTDAVFGSQGKTALFQTGSVAGTITLSAMLAVGGVDVTPSQAPSATVTIPGGAPQLRSVQIGARSANSFELLISGYTSLRTVSSLQIQFTPVTGASLATTSLSAAVDQAFASWFQNAASAAFGSQFTASVVVSVSGDANAVKSVNVSLSNSLGASNTASANLQ